MCSMRCDLSDTCYFLRREYEYDLTVDVVKKKREKMVSNSKKRKIQRKIQVFVYELAFNING